MPTPTPMRPTRSARAEDVDPAWFIVDAKGEILGRLASRVAGVLRGKHKPTYTPHVDGGDFVIVVNAALIALTGRKRESKVYYRHTGYPGGIRSTSIARMLDKHPERVLERAVRGMLPKTKLGRRMGRKLKVYARAEHPHEAQKPEPLVIGS